MKSVSKGLATLKGSGYSSVDLCLVTSMREVLGGNLTRDGCASRGFKPLSPPLLFRYYLYPFQTGLSR